MFLELGPGDRSTDAHLHEHVSPAGENARIADRSGDTCETDRTCQNGASAIVRVNLG